eukprot:scaffold3768_cov376-Prasinococcus_capsulatus_cf.AAC.7
MGPRVSSPGIRTFRKRAVGGAPRVRGGLRLIWSPPLTGRRISRPGPLGVGLSGPNEEAAGWGPQCPAPCAHLHALSLTLRSPATLPWASRLCRHTPSHSVSLREPPAWQGPWRRCGRERARLHWGAHRISSPLWWGPREFAGTFAALPSPAPQRAPRPLPTLSGCAEGASGAARGAPEAGSKGEPSSDWP